MKTVLFGILASSALAIDPHSCAYWSTYLEEISLLERILHRVSLAGDSEVIMEIRERIRAIQKQMSEGQYEPLEAE